MDKGCKGRNANGEPCGAAHYRGGWCRWHHPDLADQRLAERTAGGYARSNKARAKKQLADQAMSIADIDNSLCLALGQVSTGAMEPGVGTAMASIARTVVSIRQVGEFEQRLASLEQAANIGSPRKSG